MRHLIFSLFFIQLFSLVTYAQLSRLPRQRTSKIIPNDVELIYTKGLKYLTTTQNAKGSWGTGGYGDAPGCVGLSLLAMLAHGDDPNHGPYKKQIAASIDYILSLQATNGFITQNSTTSHGSMYNHGFATLALAEAYGMVNNDKLGVALQKAVDLILTSQKGNPLGGWRYSPSAKDSDSTVAGCQIVALFAARNAGISVPDKALKRALAYMDTCRSSQDGSYGYMNAVGGKVTLTAIGVLCDSLAKRKDTEAFKKSLAYLKNNMNYRDSYHPFYFEYYMSQALFHADEQSWANWNKLNIKFLKALQKPNGAISGNYGEAFSTSASLLSLALNYRFLPIYEK